MYSGQVFTSNGPILQNTDAKVKEMIYSYLKFILQQQ
jgi:hypothetical protein